MTKDWYNRLNNQQKDVIRAALAAAYTDELVEKMVLDELNTVPPAKQSVETIQLLEKTAYERVIDFNTSGRDEQDLLEIGFGFAEADHAVTSLHGLLGKYLAIVHSPEIEIRHNNLKAEIDRLNHELQTRGSDTEKVEIARKQLKEIQMIEYERAVEVMLRVFPELSREKLLEAALSFSVILPIEKGEMTNTKERDVQKRSLH